MNGTCEAVRHEVEVSPRYCVVKLDRTNDWTPDIAQRGKRILGVYLFDSNSRVYGEAAPEYECLFVGSQFANPNLSDREADWLSWEISERDDRADPVRHFPCGEIDALAPIGEGDLSEGVIDLGLDNEEDAFEFLRLRSA